LWQTIKSFPELARKLIDATPPRIGVLGGEHQIREVISQLQVGSLQVQHCLSFGTTAVLIFI
jgi:hypothetical protein